MHSSDAPEPDPSTDPIRVAEVAVAAYQWDAWRTTALAAGRTARRWSLIIGIAAAAAAAGAGVALLPGVAKFSAILYAPVIAWPAASWLRALIMRRQLARLVDDIRPLVVPGLVTRLDDNRLLKILTDGGSLVTELSTTIVAERRDATVALVAKEYDMRFAPVLNFPSAGGG